MVQQLVYNVEEMTQEIYDEWDNLIKTQECAECGSHLTRYVIPPPEGSPAGTLGKKALGCAHDHSHTGFRQLTCYTEDYRRGMEVHPTIRDKIERKMMNKTEFVRAVQLLALRFPDAIKDKAGAALFINDCMRLGLDPLIQPAEAVPIAFKSKDKDNKEKWTVAMIVTEDGALSMAARGCPDEYDGAPATMPLLDYLMSAHPQRPLEELEKIAEHIAKELCDDAKAYVWVAMGKRRGAADVNPVYGYYTQAERKKAADKRLPAASQPGNQARVRAVKRWVRETFPEARQRMLEYTEALNRRSEGVQEALEWIDAEYRILATPDDKTPLISPPGGQKAVGATKAARTTGTKKADNKVGERAERLPGQGVAGEGLDKSAAEPSVAVEATSLSTTDIPDMATAREASAAAETGGIPIDWPWVYETFKLIKWSEDTCRSFISGVLKENADGDLRTIIPHLPRDKAERLFRELQSKRDSVQPSFFDQD